MKIVLNATYFEVGITATDVSIKPLKILFTTKTSTATLSS